MTGEKNIRIRTGKKGILKPGHPWIFKSQILKADPAIKPGDIISVTDNAGKLLGRGYYNSKSEITIRFLTFIDEPIDTNFFHKRITQAVDKRKNLLALTNAYRVVFSEADALPGLIIDLYNDTAVFQVLTLGIEKFKPQIADMIDEILRPKYIYEKSVSPFRELEGVKDLTGWWGDEGRGLVEISEGRAKFLVDIVNGHKTGFYLDQRRSRMSLESISKNKKVLDLFCYTGGFSISAAINGAKSVLGADIKEEWLKLARENAKLNGAGEKTEFVKGDSFEVLKNVNNADEKFDIIILDPPSFLKKRESVISASKGYKELNALAMKALTEGGILATFSCSHNMPNDLFSKIIKEAAVEANKKFTILKRCHQSEDHPIVRAIPETEYLKGYFLKVFEGTNIGG
jgi:23S rRNA (cytosine1962-C5)-methyltransferase